MKRTMNKSKYLLNVITLTLTAALSTMALTSCVKENSIKTTNTVEEDYEKYELVMVDVTDSGSSEDSFYAGELCRDVNYNNLSESYKDGDYIGKKIKYKAVDGKEYEVEYIKTYKYYVLGDLICDHYYFYEDENFCMIDINRKTGECVNEVSGNIERDKYEKNSEDECLKAAESFIVESLDVDRDAYRLSKCQYNNISYKFIYSKYIGDMETSDGFSVQVFECGARVQGYDLRWYGCLDGVTEADIDPQAVELGANAVSERIDEIFKNNNMSYRIVTENENTSYQLDRIRGDRLAIQYQVVVERENGFDDLLIFMYFIN